MEGREPQPRIGVVIITGLPGAGRTALLRELLATMPPDVAPAVCVHHFAKAFGLETSSPLSPASLSGKDRAVVADTVSPPSVVHYSEVYDFGSGCICCSPDGDLARVLREIASPASSPACNDLQPPGQQRPSHLLIETTGLADPATFVRVFEQPEHAALFALLGVVAVLSAPNILPRRDIGQPDPEGQRCALQLEVTDVVLLNKSDLLLEKDDSRSLAGVEAAAEAVAEAERLVADHCPASAALHRSVLSLDSDVGEKVGWSTLLMLLPKDGAAACAVPCTDISCAPSADGGLGLGVGGGLSMPTLNWGGGHDSSFCTAVCVEDGAVLWPQAERWLLKLLQRVQRLQGYFAINKQHSKVFGHPLSSDTNFADDEDSEMCLVHVVSGVHGQPLQVEPIVLPALTTTSSEANDASRRAGLDDIGLAVKTAAKEPHCCKLFTVCVSGGAGNEAPLRESELSAGLRDVMAPVGYALIGDLTLDFPSALEYFVSKSTAAAAAAAADAPSEEQAVALPRGRPRTTTPAERVIEVDAAREAVVTWTGSEFVCVLRPAIESRTNVDDSALPQPTVEADVWVVGTKLYANIES